MAGLDWERTCWRDGYQFVAGVDEAGRGALAGPIVAAAVVLPVKTRLTRAICEIDDSKVLSAERQTTLAYLIREVAVCWNVSFVEAEVIDEIGIARSNRMAMEQAVEGLSASVDFVLLDALTCDLGAPQIGLIDGDAISISIAAASILAKTARDQFMHEHHDRDCRYHFNRHVGYGTPLHLASLREHGPSPIHRKTFRGVIQE